MINTVFKALLDNIISNNKGANWRKILVTVNIISCLIVIFTYVDWKYYDFLSHVDYDVFPLLPNVIRKFPYLVILIITMVYQLFQSSILRGVIRLDNGTNKLKTVWTCIEFVAAGLVSIIFLIYAINFLIEFANNIMPKNDYPLIIAIVCICFCIGKKIVTSFRIKYLEANIEYTNYYDCDNKRIPIEGRVIHKGKEYIVYKNAERVFLYDSESKKKIGIEEVGRDIKLL